MSLICMFDGGQHQVVSVQRHRHHAIYRYFLFPKIDNTSRPPICESVVMVTSHLCSCTHSLKSLSSTCLQTIWTRSQTQCITLMLVFNSSQDQVYLKIPCLGMTYHAFRLLHENISSQVCMVYADIPCFVYMHTLTNLAQAVHLLTESDALPVKLFSFLFLFKLD